MKYDEKGLIPVITQDAATKEVLMLAYANEEALNKTKETGEAHYYSRSRQELWHKGATSGNTQKITDIRYDCDSDALLYLVKPKGPACHTNENSCFYRSLLDKEVKSDLQYIIETRKKEPKEGSYTTYLFEQGLDKILKKIGEESAETIIAAKNNDKAEVAYECADLVYHLTVMLVELGMDWSDVVGELEMRK